MIATEIDGVWYAAKLDEDVDYKIDDDLDDMTAREYVDYQNGQWCYVSITISAHYAEPTYWDPDETLMEDYIASCGGYRSSDGHYLSQQADELLAEALCAYRPPRYVTGRQAIAAGACSAGMLYVLDGYMTRTGRIPSLETPIPIAAIDATDYRSEALLAASRY